MSEETELKEPIEPITEEIKADVTEEEIRQMMAPYSAASVTIDTPEAEIKPSAEPVPGNDAPYGRYKSGAKKGQPKPGPKQPFTGQPTDQPNATLSGSIIDGMMFLTIIDLLFPIVISLVNNFISTDKIDPKDLKITDSQKKELKPIVDAALKDVNFDANPGWMLVLSLAGLYAMNLMRAKMEKML